jgi:superfamily II RNA helicase
MSFLRIPDLSQACSEYPPADPAISYTFPLDPFQQWAVAALHREENVLVTAKTGSGKTLVAEYAIAKQLAAGRRVFYTTPIKSLSNQKYHDLKKLFPAASVGILTGDIKSNPDAQIVIMTTEILRNLLFKASTNTATLGTAGAVRMEGVGAVVFDEVHYINDPDRGHVWEECLILMPPTIRLVLLSATMDRPESFAEWLGEIKQVPCWLLATTYRIVPLVHSLWSPGLKESLVLKDRDEAQANVGLYRDWLRSREAVKDAHDDWRRTVGNARRAGESAAGLKGKVKLQSFQHQLNECIATMAAKELLPALFFSFSRKECERFADKVTGSLLTSSEEADVKHILSFHLHRYTEVLQHLPQYHQLVRLLERGIAFHHSGLLPILKEGVELLFQRGFVKVLFCTESLAIGVNLPARSVVFTGLEKPAGEGVFRPLRYDEYAQMAGRAGRRGKDTRGFVYYLPAREPLAAEELRGVMSGSLPSLQSRIQFHYDFVLKAVHLASAGPSSSEPLWERLLEKSYWSVQRAAALRQLQSEKAAAATVLESQKARITVAQRSAFEERATLETQVRVLKNAKQKAAKLALQRWTDEHMGVAWRNAEAAWKREKELEAHAEALEAEWVAATRGTVADRLAPVLKALRSWGFLDGWVSSADLTEPQVPTLTHDGILATECNEGNPILMTKLYLSGVLKDRDATEIVGTLASFVTDAVPAEGCEGLGPIVKEAQDLLDSWGKQGERLDREAGVESPEMFWRTHPYWANILASWMDGAEAAAIVRDYGVYEGNLMRGFLKTANLVEEWQAIATYCGDLETLEKLKDVRGTLLRDIAQPESLYLRL